MQKLPEPIGRRGRTGVSSSGRSAQRRRSGRAPRWSPAMRSAIPRANMSSDLLSLFNDRANSPGRPLRAERRTAAGFRDGADVRTCPLGGGLSEVCGCRTVPVPGGRRLRKIGRSRVGFPAYPSSKSCRAFAKAKRASCRINDSRDLRHPRARSRLECMAASTLYHCSDTVPIPGRQLGCAAQRGTHVPVRGARRCGAEYPSGPKAVIAECRRDQVLPYNFRQPERRSAVVAHHYPKLFRLLEKQAAVGCVEQAVAPRRREAFQQTCSPKQPFQFRWDILPSNVPNIVIRVSRDRNT